jgi:hypothetical protein
MKITIAKASEQLYQGQKIAAIKRLRALTGICLKEAKDGIELCMEQGQPQTYELHSVEPESLTYAVQELAACGVEVKGVEVKGVKPSSSDAAFIKGTLYRAVAQKRWGIAADLLQLLARL